MRARTRARPHGTLEFCAVAGSTQHGSREHTATTGQQTEKLRKPKPLQRSESMMHREGNGMRVRGERRSKLVNARDTHSDPGPREERREHRQGRRRRPRPLRAGAGSSGRGRPWPRWPVLRCAGCRRTDLATRTRSCAGHQRVSIHHSRHVCMHPGEHSLDVDRLVPLEAGERRRSGQGLLDVADDVVPAEHPVLGRERDCEFI